MSPHSPTHSLISQELERVVASKPFARAPQLIRFLRFVVEEQLAGRGDSLKEYRIGVEILGRPAGFDPKIDPIVRVRARHLREKLCEYYEAEGMQSPVRIELPKGGYVPAIAFARPSGPLMPSRTAGRWWGGRWLALAGTICLATALAALWWFGARSRAGPVLPDFRALTFERNWTTDPALSADGRWLAYSSDRAGSRDIWIEDRNHPGSAVRLTDHVTNEVTPDISPDGSRVVYRAFRDGGGIYIKNTSGGPEVLLVQGGFIPRFSPDGSEIVYAALQGGMSMVHVLDLKAKSTRQIGSWLSSANCPVWLPDGKQILYRGQDVKSGRHDWWLSPTRFDGQGDWPAYPTGASGMVAGGHRLLEADQTCPAQVLGNQVVFIERDLVWRVELRDGRIVGAPEQLSQQPGANQPRARIAPGNRLEVVFSMGHSDNQLWSLPLNKRGLGAGPITRITNDLTIGGGAYGSRAALSSEGRWLYFVSLRFEQPSISRVDMQTKDTSVVVEPWAGGVGPALAGPGQEFGYDRHMPDQHEFVWKKPGSAERLICKGCGTPLSCSADGTRILFLRFGKLTIFDVRGGTRRDLPLPAGVTPLFATISHDGNWIAAGIQNAGKVPMQGIVFPADRIDAATPAVTIAEEAYHLNLHWSHDGSGVYYFSTLDGFRCLYLQRVDPRTRRPVGKPEVAHHFHESQHYPWGGAWLAVGLDQIVMNLTDNIANLARVEVDSK